MNRPSLRPMPSLGVRLALLSFLLMLALVAQASEVGSVSPSLDADMPALHGDRQYPHLDCSACLTVASVLGGRMNTSLKESSASVLVSHRLEKDAGDRRIGYRGSELRAIEIMENGCAESLFRDNVMRLNAQTKVREYHNVFQSSMLDAGHAAFLEGTKFPEDEEQNFAHNYLRMPVAKHYTRTEVDSFATRAPEALCSFLMEEREEAVAEIIRHAEYLTEVEEQLCGYRHDWRPPSSKDAPWQGLTDPALHVCADAEQLAKSAKRDQRRWTHWNQRTSSTTTQASPPPPDGSDAGASADGDL